MKLSPEQEANLRAISVKFQSAAQELFQLYEPNDVALKNLFPEERKAKLAELQAKRGEFQRKLEELGKDIVRQVDAVLTPAQLAVLKKTALQRKAYAALMEPDTEILKFIGATPEQVAKLRRLGEEQLTPNLEFYRETGEKALSVITPEQQKKLEEELDRRGWM